MKAVLIDLLYGVVLLAYLPVLWYKDKLHAAFFQRFGVWPSSLRSTIAHPRNIWIHAVSVGEVQVMSAMLRALADRYPDHRIVLSVSTKTGHGFAKKMCGPNVQVIWAPLDFSFTVRAYIRYIRPCLYLAAETEIWPNLLAALKRRKVPIIIANGRISDRSYKRYLRFKMLLKDPFHKPDVYCMQSDVDAERVLTLGADPQTVHVVGNLKFDALPFEDHVPVPSVLQNKTIWIAGSTHPGEEEIVLGAYQKLKTQFPDIHLIIAPRHVERAPDIERIVKDFGWDALKFTALEDQWPDDHVIVVNTIGHLKTLYNAATVVFVGKSLKGGGGQNILEPAFFGKPVIVGPLMNNFRDITAAFVSEEAIIQIPSERDLLPAVERCIRDSAYAAELGRRARQVIDRQRGATTKTLTYLEPCMSARS